MHAVCTLPARCPTKTLCGLLGPEGMGTYLYGYLFCKLYAHCQRDVCMLYACCQHYQDYYTTLFQLGAYLWPCTFKIMVFLIFFLDLN